MSIFERAGSVPEPTKTPEEELRREVGRLTEQLAQERKGREALQTVIEHLGIDALTELPRRERFLKQLEALLPHPEEHRRRLPERMSLLFIDLDFFKDVNDSYGHAVGDEVLRAVAQAVRDSVRDTDLLGRMGGEELAVALPDATETQAAQKAEEIRKRVEELRFGIEKLRVTISIGVATAETGEPVSFSEFMKAADDALYLAKDTGRNRVVTASDERSERSRQGELPV